MNYTENDRHPTSKKPFSRQELGERFECYDAFHNPTRTRHQQPPLTAAPLPVVDLNDIHQHITNYVRQLLGDGGPAREALLVYKMIPTVWRDQVKDWKTFLVCHLKHHEDLQVSLVNQNCRFFHTDTNAWARTSMFNLNARINQLECLFLRLNFVITRI